MLNYAVEEFTDKIFEEIKPMMDLYMIEVAKPFHNFPPDPDLSMYKILQKLGKLICISGRDDKGNLKAFAGIVIDRHPHYACVYGSLPILFLHPDYRKGSEGMRLVIRVEKEAEKAGVQWLITHGGMHNDVYRLFEGMHYVDFGRYYAKILKNGPNGVNPVYKEELKWEH